MVSRPSSAACVCGEINTRHCPVHGQGETTAADRRVHARLVTGSEVVRYNRAGKWYIEGVGRCSTLACGRRSQTSKRKVYLMPERSAARVPLRRRFRRMNHIYANMASYFWLPCPICGQMFGGHESGTKSVPDSDSAKAAEGYGWIACWRHG